MKFDENCRDCPRLSSFLRDVKSENKDYFCKPVPAFGSEKPKLLIVGLAPGMHGANKTGRPFTGDYAGVLLYKTLYKYGFSNKPESLSDNDGLVLEDVRITNAVKCLPPQNKPDTQEIRECNKYLSYEIAQHQNCLIILALGKIAHDAILMSANTPKNQFKFTHGARHQLSESRILYDSYHCSRYNTQTKRLTERMFQSVFFEIKKEMEK